MSDFYILLYTVPVTILSPICLQNGYIYVYSYLLIAVSPCVYF